VESVENQTQVSPSFHRPLEIRPTTPDFHIPTAPTIPVPFSAKTKTQERKSAAARPPHPDRFQDHLALETLPRFRIILGLENA
jgi:hypothetical protein